MADNTSEAVTRSLAAVGPVGAHVLAWGWVSGLLVGGGAYLALLAVPSEHITQTRLLTTLFVLGLLQGAHSRSAWWWAVPLGTVGTVAGFLLSAGGAPVMSALRLFADVVIVNTPGLLAAVLGLLARVVGERVNRRMLAAQRR